MMNRRNFFGMFIGSLVPSSLRGQDEVAKYADFPPEKGRYFVVPLRIIDGDTVEIGVIVPVARGRLKDIDTPEMDTAEGKEAKKFLEANLPTGRMTEGVISGKDKYGGLEFDLLGKGGVWVTKALLDHKHAKPWPGGKGPKPFPRRGE